MGSHEGRFRTARLTPVWKLIAFGCAFAAVSLVRADEDVPLHFARLDLTDGRKLKNVVIKSYDAKSEKLLIVASGKAMTVPIRLLPPPYDQKLKSAPPTG